MKPTLAIVLVSLLALPELASSEAHAPTAKVGGATTVHDSSSNAFSLPAANLSLLRQEDFFSGRAFFKLPWVTAPSSTTARDGLGPVFNQRTCLGCHPRNGRGQPPQDEQEGFQSMLLRLSIPASNSAADQKLLQQHGSVPEPTYGGQLQPQSLRGLAAEGNAYFDYTEVQGQFEDGESYTLLKPKLRIENLQYGDLHPDVQTSPRVAPIMVGLGLLSAIAEQDILANADPDDSNQDGISGRPNYVWDIATQQTVLGRYGWKANQPNIHQQNASAFSGDLGITSDLFPEQSCTAKQTDCQQAPDGGKPELPLDLMSKVNYYVALLGVPARRNINDPEVLKGQRLFTKAGCTSCHTPKFTTAEKAGFSELSAQTIHPYSDLLLHDMGAELADQRPDFLATGQEWRTPPLWGLGLLATVNGHTRLLHDGRARNVLEAVLWHGGEAKSSQQQVLAMTKTEREALIKFLQSL